MRSVSVVLPASMCAMIPMLRTSDLFTTHTASRSPWSLRDNPTAHRSRPCQFEPAQGGAVGSTGGGLARPLRIDHVAPTPPGPICRGRRRLPGKMRVGLVGLGHLVRVLA